MFPRKTRMIQARFAGKCRACGCAIAKGENVWFAKHYGVRCENCGAHTADDQPLPSKRPGKRRRRSSEPRRPVPPAPSDPAPTPAPGTKAPAARGTMPGPEALAKQAECGSDDVYRVQFDSIRAMVEDALDDYAQSDLNRERIRAAQDDALSGREAWGNYFTRQKLIDQLHQPDAGLLDAIDQMRHHLIGDVSTPVAPRRRIRRGQDFGDELDADRWLQRDPQAWERNVRDSQPRRTVTIGCNVSVHAKQQPGELLFRGAAALALADLLTSRGYSVEIVLFKAVSDVTPRVESGVVKCQIKDPLMPLSVADLALALCEIAFARSVVICGAARHWPGDLRSGWGSPRGLPARDAKAIDFLIENHVTSREAAATWLRAQLGREVNHAA